jgi:hypothetical protein
MFLFNCICQHVYLKSLIIMITQFVGIFVPMFFQMEMKNLSSFVMVCKLQLCVKLVIFFH